MVFATRDSVGLKAAYSHLSFSTQVQALQITHNESLSVDPKLASQKFLAANKPAHCHAQKLGDVLERDSFQCAFHKSGKKGVVRECQVPNKVRPDVTIIGFPCSPYSAQRSNRFSCEGMLGPKKHRFFF